MIQRDCPAKINLYLRVLGCRKEGYHSLETLFQEIDLVDRLTWFPQAGPLKLEVRGVQVGPQQDNLVWRAIQRFSEETGQVVAGRFLLEKYIPVGAGLGGGSSDAATTLTLLNEYFGYPLDQDRLAEQALELGSDVPFFLLGGCRLGRGRGELLWPHATPACPHGGFLLLPGLFISTTATFKAYAGCSGPSANQVPFLGENHLLEAAQAVSPSFARVWAVLKQHFVGELFFMSGSGSTCVWLTQETEMPVSCKALLDELGVAFLAFRFVGNSSGSITQISEPMS